MKLLRSLLYVPANKPRMIEKATAGISSDAIIFDLEDAVPQNEKATARENLVALTGINWDPSIFVRVNSVMSEFFADDMKALSAIQPGGIVLPKADEDAVRHTCAKLDELGNPPIQSMGKIQLIPLIESALAVETVMNIIEASPRVIGAQLGAEDLTCDLGICFSGQPDQLGYARHRVVYGCHACGVPSYDTPFRDFHDQKTLASECQLAKNIGFTGKTCIHPTQLETVNSSFTPTPTELEAAKRIVTAADQAKFTDSGVFSMDGEMIDRPVVERARAVLKLAEHQR